LKAKKPREHRERLFLRKAAHHLPISNFSNSVHPFVRALHINNIITKYTKITTTEKGLKGDSTKGQEMVSFSIPFLEKTMYLKEDIWQINQSAKFDVIWQIYFGK